MPEGKTIRQIAEEIGVSKQAIAYRLKQMEKENERQKNRQILAVKEDGILWISLAAESLIKSAFIEGERQTFGTKQAPNDRQREDDILSVLKVTIDTLKTQLEVKDRQMEIKDKQIEDLSSALVAAQQMAQAAQALHAGTIQNQLTSGGADREDEPPSQAKKGWKFWKK